MYDLIESEGKLATLLFALIVTKNNCWELLGKQHSAFHQQNCKTLCASEWSSAVETATASACTADKL